MNVNKLPLTVQNNHFTWPSLFPVTGTLLLAVSVKTSLCNWSPPRIELQYEQASLSIQLPSEASGVIYLELSQWLEKQVPENAGIQVKTIGARLIKEQALLSYYPHEANLHGQKVLVIAPHPDDAEIAAFGLYSKQDSAILTVTAGEAGFNPYQQWIKDIKRAAEFKAKLRVFDSLTTPLWGGVPKENTLNLGYKDNSLQALKKNQITDAMCREFHQPKWLPERTHLSWSSLLEDIHCCLMHWQPEILVLPHPLYDEHDDHRMTTRAVLEVLAKNPGSVRKLFFYINHAKESAAYPWGNAGEPRAFYSAWIEEASAFYSIALGEEEQVNKLFALDMMHDLRYPPAIKSKNRLCKFTNKAWRKWDPYRKRTSFYRKAIRSSEFFWVYNIADAKSLLEFF